MQSEDLDELLEQARSSNASQGISGALVYTDGMFLQILEGERAKVQTLMASIVKDVRHENVTILRESEIPSARFSSWGMAYVGATTEQVARWAGVGVETEEGEVVKNDGGNLDRTAQFVQDIVALLAPGNVAEQQGNKTGPGVA